VLEKDASEFLLRRLSPHLFGSSGQVEEHHGPEAGRAKSDGLDGDSRKLHFKHSAAYDRYAGKRLADVAKQVEHSRFIEMHSASD
jgi:hypothetical protein